MQNRSPHACRTTWPRGIDPHQRRKDTRCANCSLSASNLGKGTPVRLRQRTPPHPAGGGEVRPDVRQHPLREARRRNPPAGCFRLALGQAPTLRRAWDPLPRLPFPALNDLAHALAAEAELVAHALERRVHAAVCVLRHDPGVPLAIATIPLWLPGRESGVRSYNRPGNSTVLRMLGGTNPLLHGCGSDEPSEVRAGTTAVKSAADDGEGFTAHSLGTWRREGFGSERGRSGCARPAGIPISSAKSPTTTPRFVRR